MKHILNEMSEEERNSIRSQHTGSLQVQTEKFKALVEKKLGEAKPLINEQFESFTAFDEQEDGPSTEDMPLAPMDEDDSDYRMYDLPSIHQDIEDELMEMSDDEGREYLNEIIEFCEDKLNGYPEGDSEEDEDMMDLGISESYLTRIVKRVINEQSEDEYEGNYEPTLKEKIESVIRDSVTNREEIIQVLEDILRERKSANSMRDRLRR